MGSKWTARKKTVLALLILTVIPMIVILPGVFWELHNARKCLDQFSNSLVAKNYSQAYTFTAPEPRATTNYQSFVKIHNDLDTRLGELTSVDVDQTEVKDKKDGWYATAETQLNFANGSLPFTFILKKEDGAWKVYSYHEQ